MTERLDHTPEKQTGHLDTSAESAKNAERLREKAEKTPEADKKTVEHLSHKAKEQAISGKETPVGEQHEHSSAPLMTRAIKQETYQKTLRRIQSQLSASQRVFSNVIHQPVIEKISIIGSQTVSRPSGILGGAVCAFLGSLSLLILSKRVGFTYNYLVFFVLFLGGFLFGLTIELLAKVLRLPRR